MTRLVNMGQKSSKRQSFTPGGKQDAGLPTASVTENGDIQSGGANGQVRLISNKETPGSDVITSDVTSTSSAAATAASLPPPTEKKKKKTSRFVFSLKRTGSGKRSKKTRGREANGVRPTSYPPAPSSSDQTTGPRATDRDRKAQSMFVEVLSDDLQEDAIQKSASSDDVTVTGQVATLPSPSKKTSTDSTASSSKGNKRKNSSQKHKNASKKKDKEPKKKSKKKKEETDKAEKGEEQDEKATAVAAVAAAIAAAAASGDEEAAVKVEEGPVPEGDTTQEQEPALQAVSADTEKSNDGTEEEVTTESKDEIEPQSTKLEEPVEETIGLSVAAVSEAEVKLSFPDNTTEEPLVEPEEEEEEEEPAMTAEQLLAEIEQTILSKEHTGLLDQAPQNDAQLKGPDQAEPEHQDVAETEETETALTVAGEEVELAGQAIHEDILELSDISNQAEDAAEQERSEQPGKEETESGIPESAGNTTEAEEVLETAMTVEVQSSVEAAVRQEPVPDTVQQHVEELVVECLPKTESGIKGTEDEAQQETDPIPTKTEQGNETSQTVAQAPEQDVAGASAPEEVRPATQPAEETPQPMTPAQLRALEKELKAAKKKEEKERARREKEEKKRLKEEKKREAKEKKKKEKEEKERRLREAKEKARASANVTVEVKAEGAAIEAKEAVEEAVAASHTVTVQSAPGTSAPMDSQPRQQQQEETAVVEPQPSTSDESMDVNKEIQLSVSADAGDLPAPSSTLSSTQPPPAPPTSENKPNEQLLGSSVKEIISNIENNSGMEPKTYDESSPPQVPDTPYPDEDVMQQSSAVAQLSSAPGSPDSPTPSSPLPQDEAGDGGNSEGAGSAESSPVAKIFPPEISETARSSVLRKIELGPRLRTAILRKSSSGAESEEKRVILTQPRHVQVSDLTPPPRKPRSRRTLEHTRDSSGNYCYSSSPVKEPEPVIEEQSTVEVSAPSHSSPASPQEQKEETGGLDKEWEGTEIPKVKEQLMEDFTPPGCGSSGQTEPDPSALVAVASIVRAGQAGSSDTLPAQPATQSPPGQEEAGERSAETETQTAQPDDLVLQKVATEVVVRVQKVAQEKASVLELQDKIALDITNTDTQAEGMSATGGEDSEKCQAGFGVNVQGGDYKSDEDQDSDSEVGLMQATVVCSAELVTPSSDCAAPTQAADCHLDQSLSSGTVIQVCQGASEQSQEVLGNEAKDVERGAPSTEPSTVVLEKTETTSSSAGKPSEAERPEQADENRDHPDDLKTDDDSTDTLQLQQFNKNYYDISVVVDDDNDEEDDASKIHLDAVVGATAADNQEEKDNHTESPTCSKPSERSPSPEGTSTQQDATSEPEQPLLENGKASGGEVDLSEQEEKAGVTVRCNGSHVLNGEEADGAIDALIKLHSGVNGEKEVVLDNLEHNNNVSVEAEKSTSEHGDESTAIAGTSDSRD